MNNLSNKNTTTLLALSLLLGRGIVFSGVNM